MSRTSGGTQARLRALRSVAAIASVGLLAAACGSEPATQTQPNRIIVQNLRVQPGTEIRFGFTPKDPFGHAIVTFDPASAGVALCPLTGVDDPLPDPSKCRADVGRGVRETVTEPQMRGLAVVVSRAAVDVDVTVEFDGPSRAMTLRVPSVPAPTTAADCKDVDCSPVIEVTPVRDGRFTAGARWSGPEAQLVLLQGRILARSFTATGVPYREAATAQGSSPQQVSGALSRTGEYALVIRQGVGDAPIRNLKIAAAWP